jgi:hypothetical protein
LIRQGTEQFLVFGEMETPIDEFRWEVEGSASGLRAKVGAKAASLAELAVALPVQIIDSEIHYLI